MLASPAFSTGYAWYALKLGGAKWPARIGLALAGLELLAAVAIICIGLIVEPSTNRVW